MKEKTGIEILKKLITLDTSNPPGNEKPAAEYIRELLSPYGFLCEVQDLGGGRANLIAKLGTGMGPELMLNGHLDVVPAAKGWHSPPFSLIQRAGRGYGRGVCDMKGGVAAMCEAAIRTAEKGGPETGCLKLFFAADEECANLGTREYLKKYKPSDYAIIGEPTGLEVAVAHRGVSRDYIEIRGRARHAALPAAEEDAVMKTAAAIQAISDLNRQLSGRAHPVLPPPGISVTMLNAYEKDNIVPGHVRLLTDFRILPEMSREEAQEIIRQGLSDRGITGVQISGHFFMPGGEISAEDSFVALCCEEGGRVLKRNLIPCAFDASCEQCFLASAGTKTVICGPGNIAQAHTADEYLDLEQLASAAIFYEAVIERVIGNRRGSGVL